MNSKSEELFNKDGIYYICVYKGTNLGVLYEGSIDYSKSNTRTFDDFIQYYTNTGTYKLFLEQIESLENRVRQSGNTDNCLSDIDRKMACMNIISLVKNGKLKNDDNFGYIKVIYKDKNVIFNMDE